MYSKENLYTPTILAASRGHYQVLESLLYKGKAIIATWTPDSQETLLHVILRKSLRTGHASDQSIYEKCLNVLLESEDFCTQLKPVINKKDDLGNTCLHFAAKSWPQKVTLKLLELGANIGIRNHFGEVPLSRIQTKTLEEFLDNYCTQTKKDPDDYSDSFEVTFRYDFLAPPVTEEQLQNWDREKQTQLELEALPETDSLWYIARSKTHRHLIKHPVLTSFMWLKWQKIRRLFNRNLRFYLLFVVLLTWYIFARFGGKSLNIRGDGEDFCSELRFDESYFGFFYILFALHVLVQIGFVITDWYKDYYNDGFTSCILGSWLEIFMFLVFAIVLYGSLGLLKWVLVLLLGVMVLREGFQMLSSFKRYLLSVENWMEMFLIGILSVILFGNSVVPCKWNRHLAAIALLISWAELITMVGRHPKLARYNIYVTMFYKVLESFFYFLIWFSFFIIAFAFGFYIMLHRDNGDNVNKGDYEFFDSPWLTLAKTFTMFVGEIEFSDIPVDRSTDESEYIALPVIAYLFLLAFVFFIVVVLMNLLNGLAITDTGIIQARAEIVSNVTRVESVSYAESVLLGDPFDFLSSSSANGDGPFSWLNRHLPSCALLNALYTKSPTVRSAFQKITGATGILLFFTLLTDKSARFPHVAKGLLGGRVNAEVRDILAKSKDITRKKLKKKEDREDITIEKLYSLQNFIINSLNRQEEQILAISKKINL
ncbi:transient receptor potential cation channel protein painless [Lepeophtheirus salmonis]|uniref:transient receptor potential cation channel protein painless n=1 Tax=Lepeophtheirus salmonis TaxID=72036 RepID=UPI001AE5A9AD|nr:transient receptor potential channel pyrexia-like [Lepeophtheirus salmonis]